MSKHDLRTLRTNIVAKAFDIDDAFTITSIAETINRCAKDANLSIRVSDDEVLKSLFGAVDLQFTEFQEGVRSQRRYYIY